MNGVERLPIKRNLLPPIMEAEIFSRKVFLKTLQIECLREYDKRKKERDTER